MIAVLQIVFVTVLCVVCAWWLGVLYAMMAGLVFIVALAMFYARERALRGPSSGIVIEYPKEPAIGFFYRLVLAVFLGMVWPSLPVILGINRDPRSER